MDTAVYRNKAVDRMKRYFDEDRFITHTLRVLDRGERILAGEGIADGFYRDTATLGCIFHDIGIPEALRVHGSMDAPFQEREGPPVARRLMTEIYVRPDILERVCFMVGHHHTREKVDGADFQVIWEADFLVNIREGNLVFDSQDLPEAGMENIQTATGKTLFRELLQEL